MKIVEYGMAIGSDVQNLINDGWQPFGSPLFDSIGTLYQAVVKYEEEKL